MSSDRPFTYPKRNDHYRRQDRFRHHSRHDVSDGWSNTPHYHRPQQSGPNSWQAGSHGRWNNSENNHPKQQYPKEDQMPQWEEQQWDSLSRKWQENGSWDTRVTSQPYYQDQDGQNRHDVDEWGREVRRGRRQSPAPDDQPRRNASHQSHSKYHRGHHAEHRQQQNHDQSRYHGYDQRKRRHSPQRDQRWERQSFNGQNKRRRTDKHEPFQAQEYPDDRTKFGSQQPELRGDWIEPQYSHDHGSSQAPFSHETAPQHNGEWSYSSNDMAENHWQEPPPPRLLEPAFSSSWPPAPPLPSTWHVPHPLPPAIPLPLPLHPPIPTQPPLPQAPYPPTRSDFFDYSSPYLHGVEISPIRHAITPPIPCHLSAEPVFTRPLNPIPPDVALARGPARGPAPRQQSKARFNKHHIKKGRSALVRRFFEADEEEPAGDAVPNSASGLPPAIHQDPENTLQQVDRIPDVLLTTPELSPKPIILPAQPTALPSPQSHSPPSRPTTPEAAQGDITLAPPSPVSKPARESKASVEVTVPTPPITDSPEHDGLALVVTPIPVSQTGQRPPKVTEPFEFLGLVGQGAYGKVFKARERATGALVALKKIKSEHAQDGFPVTGLREVKLLQSLKHDNVVTLCEMISRKGDIFLKFEYVPHDLVGLLKQQHITLEHAHIKSLMNQLLKGLAYIHARGILHRDLKAANLLITANGTLKIADFGLARFYYKRNPKADYTNRVCTMWYRPPELMLGLTVYGSEVDIWSAGCIFMEMFLKEAPFRGEDEIRQLHRVYASLGSPRSEYCPELLAAPWYSLMPPAEEYDNVFAMEWSELLPPEVIAFAEKLLRVDRHARPSATGAMEDSYFSSEPLPSPPDLTSLSMDCHEYDYAKKNKRKEDKPRLRSRKAPTASTAAK